MPVNILKLVPDLLLALILALMYQAKTTTMDVVMVAFLCSRLLQWLANYSIKGTVACFISLVNVAIVKVHCKHAC